MPQIGILASKMSIGDAAITAVFGYVVVFFGLLLLMLVLHIMAAVFKSQAKKKAQAEATAKPEPAAAAAPEPEKPLAPGSAGHIKRFDVPDKEAAMIMAIVADQMGRPLNELRFLSIREVNEEANEK